MVYCRSDFLGWSALNKYLVNDIIIQIINPFLLNLLHNHINIFAFSIISQHKNVTDKSLVHKLCTTLLSLATPFQFWEDGQMTKKSKIYIWIYRERISYSPPPYWPILPSIMDKNGGISHLCCSPESYVLHFPLLPIVQFVNFSMVQVQWLPSSSSSCSSPLRVPVVFV